MRCGQRQRTETRNPLAPTPPHDRRTRISPQSDARHGSGDAPAASAGFAGSPLYGQTAGEHCHRPRLSDHGGGAPACARAAGLRELQLLHQRVHAAYRLSGHGHVHLFLQRPVPAPVRNAARRLLWPGFGAGIPRYHARGRLPACPGAWGYAFARRAALVRSAGGFLRLSAVGDARGALHERRPRPDRARRASAERGQPARGHHHSGAVLVRFPERGESVRAAISNDGKHRDRVPRHHAALMGAYRSQPHTRPAPLLHTRIFRLQYAAVCAGTAFGAGPFRRTLGAPVVRRQHTARLFRAVPTRQRRVFSVRIRHDPVDHA